MASLPYTDQDEPRPQLGPEMDDGLPSGPMKIIEYEPAPHSSFDWDVALRRIFYATGAMVFVVMVIAFGYIISILPTAQSTNNMFNVMLADFYNRRTIYEPTFDRLIYVADGITQPDPNQTRSHLQQFIQGAISSNVTYALSTLMTQMGQGNMTAMVTDVATLVANLNAIASRWLTRKSIDIEIPV